MFVFFYPMLGQLCFALGQPNGLDRPGDLLVHDVGATQQFGIKLLFFSVFFVNDSKFQ